MNTQMMIEFVRGLRMRRVFPVLVLAGFLAAFTGSAPAATATWTNTANNSSGYWINSAKWNAASYPGNGASETAYLTSNIANTYTCILDSTLAYPLNALSVSNANAGGQAWLILTNSTLTASTVTLNNGGRLQIDNNGVLTNVNTLTWTGTNGVVHLNNGGKLFSTNDVSISTASMQALVTGTGGLWDLGGKNSYVGWNVSSASLRMDDVTLTNGNIFMVGYGSTSFAAPCSNTVVITNGSHLITKIGYVGNTVAGQNAGYCTNNSVTVTANSLWDLGADSLIIGNPLCGVINGAITDNNYVWVDTGSLVTNVGAIKIDLGGNGAASGNRLVIASGGKLIGTGSNVVIGASARGYGLNGLLIDGGGVPGAPLPPILERSRLVVRRTI